MAYGYASTPQPDDTPLPALGEPALFGEGEQLAVISYANGYYLSRQALAELPAQAAAMRLLDLRCLVPLNIDAIMTALGPCRKILLVDECRRRGSLSEELFTLLHEARPGYYQIQRITAEDSFIPLGAAAYQVLPSKAQISSAMQQLLSVEALA
ncbi:transketolase C-terminal domain-containing protein [Alishewanella longhuensis]